MGVTKYFVWGEGVWREVDVASGRVVGWRRRARFVFVRRGRLQVARRRAVLRALQALAAGQPSAAADGPRLSHRSKLVATAKQQSHETPPAASATWKTPPAAPATWQTPPAAPAMWQHHHCCAHFNGCNNNNKVVNHVAASATSLVAAATCATSTTSATSATVAQKRREAGTQCGHSDAGTSTERAHAITINLTHAVRTKRDYSSGEDFVATPKRKLRSNTSEVNSLLGKQKLAVTSERTPPTSETREKRARLDTIETESTPSGERRYKPRPKSKQRAAASRDKTDTTVTKDPVPTSITVGNASRDRLVWDESDGGDGRSAVCKELIISEGDVAVLRAFVARTRASALARFDADDAYKRALFYAINPLVEVERCARLERALRERRVSALSHFAARLGLTPRTDSDSRSSATSSPARAQRRRAAARYKERSSSADTNKENKEDKRTTSNKHRNERNTNMKTTEPRAAASEPAPRLTRASGNRLGASARSHKQIEVVKKAVDAKGEAGEPAKVTRASDARLGVSERANKETAAVKDDSDDQALVSKPATKPPIGTHAISKRASASGAKEYSNLEDHAIVAWVSSGSRASLVNGNRLWRELQEQYHKLTGQSRTWHSLRNRYLRYILPALGALRLPPAHESRLRAAAATGAIKRKQSQVPGQASEVPPPRVRRQSIFKEEPVKGASSRKVQAPQPSPSDEDTHTTAIVNGPSSARRSLRSNVREEENKKAVRSRSPRYSEVTRRFAARRRPSPHTSPSSRRTSSPSPPPLIPSSSSSSSPSPSPERAGKRERRLFNPNSHI